MHIARSECCLVNKAVFIYISVGFKTIGTLALAIRPLLYVPTRFGFLSVITVKSRWPRNLILKNQQFLALKIMPKILGCQHSKNLQPYWDVSLKWRFSKRYTQNLIDLYLDAL